MNRKQTFNLARTAMLLLVMLCSIGAWADDSGTCGKTSSDHVTWTYVESSHTLTIGGTGKMASYSSVDQYPWNDYRSSITSLVFESGVTSVCDGAFSGYSNLTSVTFQQGVETIGHSAFSSCSGLKSISIPNSVTTIYSGAFFGCTNVETLELGNGLETIEAGVFSGLTSLTSLTIGDGVKTIYAGAFSGCTGLKNLTIGDGVTSIAYVFNDCTNLETIVLGAGLTFLNAGSFDGYTKLKSVTFKNGTSPLLIHEAVFRGCTSLETVTLPNNVTRIGTNAFSGCTSLTSMNIPASVTSIGESVFYNCTNLTSVAFNGPATIGSGSFPSNTTVTIDDGLYLHNGSEVLCGDVTDMSKLNSKTLQKAVKITLPTGIIASGTNVFNQSDGTYALPNATVTIAADTNYKISNVDATGADLTNNGDGTYTFTVGTTDVTVTATLLTNVVTPSNFSSFFDANGELLDAITFNELIFQGNFTNTDLGVSYITLDRTITITGDNAVLNDLGFVITGSDVTLDNLSVTYNAPNGVEAKAIFANGAENFTLTNSEIIFTGENPGEKHYRGLEVSNCNAAKIDNNTITATLPAVPVDWMGSGIAQDLVLAVGIQGGDNVEFTNNHVTVNTNGSTGSYPTIDAVMVHSANDILIKGNDITHVDNTAEDGPRYYYTLDIYSTTGTVEANDINVNTTANIDRGGTAYPIQLTGPFTVTVKDNNITTISKGPAAGIYASNWAGAADLTVKNNNIDVKGYATTGNFALVAGIEAEIDVLKAYNNTITVENGADYDDANQVIGVGIRSSYFWGNLSADIKDNDITVDGEYAVYYAKAGNINVTGNALCAHELTGDAAVYIADGDNNTVENNLDGFVNMPKTGESTYNIPANVSSFKVYDDGGQGWRYSPSCNGTLTLTAPAGYSLQLSGSIKTEKDVDYLTVYDGSSNLADVLIDQMSSSANGTETAIPTVISTGNVVTLYFHSDKSDSDKTEFDGLNLTVTVVPSTFNLTANLANGSYWTTFYYGGVSYKIDEGEDATAYTATRSGDILTLTSIGKNIPKNTAVIIKGTDNSISLTRDDNITDYTGDNELQGVNYETPQADGYTYYVLSKKGDNFGFYKLASTKNLGAHKAYLEVSTSNSTREFFGFEEDDATGLTPNPSPVGEGSWYNLNGQKLCKPQKGINIVNGKKVLY